MLLENLDLSNVDRTNVVADPSRKTTTKVRVLAGQHYAARQQVIRIDYEGRSAIDADIHTRLLNNLRPRPKMRTRSSSPTTTMASPTQPSTRSPARSHASVQTAALSIRGSGSLTIRVERATPNQDEVEQMLGKDFTDQECAALREKLGYASLLVTCGNQGMLLVTGDAEPRRLPAVGSLEPVDVTGAGDTVIAVYALGLASGLSFDEAAEIANHAGGIVVMKKGTASVSPRELLASIRSTAASEILSSSA